MQRIMHLELRFSIECHEAEIVGNAVVRYRLGIAASGTLTRSRRWCSMLMDWISHGHRRLCRFLGRKIEPNQPKLVGRWIALPGDSHE